jgi:hypothetical protein
MLRLVDLFIMAAIKSEDPESQEKLKKLEPVLKVHHDEEEKEDKMFKPVHSIDVSTIRPVAGPFVLSEMHLGFIGPGETQDNSQGTGTVATTQTEPGEGGVTYIPKDENNKTGTTAAKDK